MAGNRKGVIAVVYNGLRGYGVSSALRGCFTAEKPVWATRRLFLQVSEKGLENASFALILAFLGGFFV